MAYRKKIVCALIKHKDKNNLIMYFEWEILTHSSITRSRKPLKEKKYAIAALDRHLKIMFCTDIKSVEVNLKEEAHDENSL